MGEAHSDVPSRELTQGAQEMLSDQDGSHNSASQNVRLASEGEVAASVTPDQRKTTRRGWSFQKYGSTAFTHGASYARKNRTSTDPKSP